MLGALNGFDLETVRATRDAVRRRMEQR